MHQIGFRVQAESFVQVLPTFDTHCKCHHQGECHELGKRAVYVGLTKGVTLRCWPGC